MPIKLGPAEPLPVRGELLSREWMIFVLGLDAMEFSCRSDTSATLRSVLAGRDTLVEVRF